MLLTARYYGPIDQTETAMGSRMLRNWLLKPLLSTDAISARQNAIKEMLDPSFKRQDLVR